MLYCLKSAELGQCPYIALQQWLLDLSIYQNCQQDLLKQTAGLCS